MKFFSGKRALVFLAVAAVMLLPLAAQANLLDVTYNFTTFNQLGYTGPFVKVDVAIIDATHASITETALSNYFIDGGKNAINFNFNTVNVVTVTPPTNFSRDTQGGDQVDGYGTFNYRYEFNVAQYPGTQGPVTFTIAGTGFTADIFSLFALNGSNNFMVDAIGVNNGTSFIITGFSDTPIVDGGGGGGQVPVPPTVWLMGSGLVGLGLLRWRRKKQ